MCCTHYLNQHLRANIYAEASCYFFPQVSLKIYSVRYTNSLNFLSDLQRKLRESRNKLTGKKTKPNQTKHKNPPQNLATCILS